MSKNIQLENLTSRRCNIVTMCANQSSNLKIINFLLTSIPGKGVTSEPVATIIKSGFSAFSFEMTYPPFLISAGLNPFVLSIFLTTF